MTALLLPVDANDPRFVACGTMLTPQEDPARFGAQDAELPSLPTTRAFYVMRLRRRPPRCRYCRRHVIRAWIRGRAALLDGGGSAQ